MCCFSEEGKIFRKKSAALGPSFGHLSLRKVKVVKQHQGNHVQWDGFDFVAS